MKVLIVTSRYYPHHGGLETVVHMLSKELLEKGHELLLITNRYPLDLPRHETIDNINLVRLLFHYPTLNYLRLRRFDLFFGGLFFLPFTLFQLGIQIHKYRPDIVNLHYAGNPTFFLILLKPILKFNLITSFHGGDVAELPYLSRFNMWLFKKLLTYSDQYTTCSRALLAQVDALAPSMSAKALVILNGVDYELFSNIEPYTFHSLYFSAIGQLETHKGFDQLIRAFAIVKDKLPGVHLIIAGDGTQKIILRNLVNELDLEEEVTFLGNVSQQSVAKIMRGSIGIIIPSRRDAFGIVGVEAMASGRQIIASPTDGLLEALGNAEVAWATSQVEIAHALYSAYLDKDTTMVANQQKAKAYSWKFVTTKYLDAYHRATNNL